MAKVAIADIRRMIKQGMNYREIGDHFGVSHHYVGIIVRRHGISARSRRRKYTNELMHRVAQGVANGKTIHVLATEIGFTYREFQHWLSKRRGMTIGDFREWAWAQYGPDSVNNSVTPCMLPLEKWPVCYESRCYLKDKCISYQKGNQQQEVE